MGTLGVWLLIFGVGSIILNQLGREFTILMWIDMWGPSVGWGIRIGMIALGAVLLLFAAMSANSDSGSEE